MQNNFYQLLKYASTGIASPDMTYYDRMRASTLMGGTVKTLTGQPPLVFKADGKPLISWSMKGNGSQTGTPTPDAPIMPDFCGVRTGNLFDVSAAKLKKRVTSSGEQDNDAYACSDYINVFGAVSLACNYRNEGSSNFYFYDSNKDLISYEGAYTANIPNGTQYVRVNIPISTVSQYMLNLGSTAIPYEPFGYKIPITCAGQTTPIYTGDPLRKALDGSDAVDMLSSTGTITREVDAEGNALATPTTQIVDVPEIPTAKVQNTLTVDTDLQPSEMTITYRG